MNDTIVKHFPLNSEIQLIINYTVTSCKKEFVDIGDQVVYGLKVVSKSNVTALEDECIIEDISTKRDFVEKIVSALAENLVFPSHIKDIIVDYIS